jgi:hypothetical protein
MATARGGTPSGQAADARCSLCAGSYQRASESVAPASFRSSTRYNHMSPLGRAAVPWPGSQQG